MRKIERHIYRLMFLLCLTAQSCTKSVAPEEGRTVIFTQQMLTRGTSLQSLDGLSFGVRGYSYDKSWADAAPVVKPNPEWKNIKIDVTQNGDCRYNAVNKPILWEHQKNYSFFACYPFPGEGKGPTNLSPVSESGPPTLTYQLNAGALTDMSLMDDVMYAAAFDENEMITSSVGLSFRHCMFGLQMVLVNLNEYVPSSPRQGIEISKLVFEIDQVDYQSMKIVMDGSKVTYVPFSAPQQAQYDYLKNGKIQLPSTLNENYLDVSKDSHLLLIPQKGLTGTIHVVYDGRAEDVRVDFSKIDFQPGTRYLFGLEFIGDSVNAILVEANAWTDVNENIEFE